MNIEEIDSSDNKRVTFEDKEGEDSAEKEEQGVTDTDDVVETASLTRAVPSGDLSLRKERSFFFHDDSDEGDYSTFHETVYTLLYMSKPSSQPFIFSLAVYCIQMIMILLTLFDALNMESSENKLAIPAMVSLPTTIAQFIVLFLAVAYQSDLIEAVPKLQEGPHNEFIQDPNTGATYFSWLFSGLAQFFAGFSLLMTIFVLTMQSDNVLSMMLNFAALHFMAEIDDISFALAKKGFVSNVIQDEIDRVLTYRVAERLPTGKKDNMFRRVLYVMVSLALLIGYALVKRDQIRGRYLCSTLYVQFGDAFNPELAHYSGLYETLDGSTSFHRRYVDLVTKSSILLGYCETERFWTFSYFSLDDPCTNYFAETKETTTYDVTSISVSDWSVTELSTGNTVPFDAFVLACNDDNCLKSEKCGSCEGKKFGVVRCEEMNLCEEINVDSRTNNFPRIYEDPLDNTFRMLYDNTTNAPVRLYNMPVYYSDRVVPANLIFFTGRRWVLTDTSILRPLPTTSPPKPAFSRSVPVDTIDWKKIQPMLLRRRQAFTPFYMSEPIDFNTATFSFTPEGVGWVAAMPVANKNGTVVFTADRSQSAPSTLLDCAQCVNQPEGYCLNKGVCNNETKRCDCENDFTSARCETEIPCYDQEEPCYNIGICDPVGGECRCAPHTYGKLCDENYLCNEAQGKCYHGGVCNETIGCCTCVDPATLGCSCDIRDHCTAFGCSNGGACNNETGACECPEPYFGLLCDLSREVADCTACRDGTVCKKDSGSCVIPLCTDEGIECANGGQCDEALGSCDCVGELVSGLLCETKVNCTESGCFNGGICDADVGYCYCPRPYFGILCGSVLIEV